MPDVFSGRRQRERQTSKRFDQQNNNFARFFVHFFAVVARLRDQPSFFFSWTLIQSFNIQLLKNSPTFDELNKMEKAR